MEYDHFQDDDGEDPQGYPALQDQWILYGQRRFLTVIYNRPHKNTKEKTLWARLRGKGSTPKMTDTSTSR